MKTKNALEVLFPNGKVPDVDVFKRDLKKLSKEGRSRMLEKIFRIALSAWVTLPKKHQDFIEAVIVHDRQAYVDFVRIKTVMGRLLYPLRNPALFIGMLHLTEAVERRTCPSLNHLAMSVLTSFAFHWKVGTLVGHVTRKCLTYEEVLVLAGKTAITDYCGI